MILNKNITIKASVFALLIAIIFVGCQHKTADTSGKETGNSTDKVKNVVVIISDDHSIETVGVYGNQHIRTPNMDKLAEQGVKFTKAYSQSPICAPSRQSMLSGKYAYATGVSLVFTPFPDYGNTTIAEVLQEEDFATALIGKNHFNNFFWSDLYKGDYPKYGFDTIIFKHPQYQQWLKDNPMPEIPDDIETSHSDKAAHKNPEYKPEAAYDSFAVGTFYAREAIRFMEENHKKDKPFFLWLAFHEPHSPFNFPIEYADSYNPAELPMGQQGPEDERWIPEMFRDLTEEERRGIIASYYTSVEYMDKNMGLVVDALDKMGLAENTLVIYTSDQGYHLNDHGRFEKHTMYREAVQAPLIVRGPGIPKNRETDALVELLDLAPTFTDYLGVKQATDWQGKSFRNVLENPEAKHRDFVFSTYHHDNKAMVANKKWKYIFTTGQHDFDLDYQTGYGPSGIYHKLYDLENDPGELRNLAYREEYLDTLRKFRDVMLQKFENTHPLAENCPEELNKLGQLVWYLEPRDAGSTYGPPVSVRIKDSLRIDIYD